MHKPLAKPQLRIDPNLLYGNFHSWISVPLANDFSWLKSLGTFLHCRFDFHCFSFSLRQVKKKVWSANLEECMIDPIENSLRFRWDLSLRMDVTHAFVPPLFLPCRVQTFYVKIDSCLTKFFKSLEFIPLKFLQTDGQGSVSLGMNYRPLVRIYGHDWLGWNDEFLSSFRLDHNFGISSFLVVVQYQGERVVAINKCNCASWIYVTSGTNR